MKKLRKYKTIISLVCIFTCILFIGCQKKTPTKNSNTNTSQSTNNEEIEIEKITVTFDDDNGTTKKVSVNLLENSKTTIEFQEEALETTEEFDVEDSFSEFIKTNILSDSSSGEDSKEESDDQKVLWRIEVRTNQDDFQSNGFDEYPSYWEELLEYMGV
ncbi:hypothetical protein [Anaerosporobacter sp.]